MAEQLYLPVGFSYATTRFAGNGYKKGALVTWGFKNPVSSAAPQILADDLKAAFGTAFGTPLSYYSSTLVMDEVTAKNGPVATGGYFVETANVVMGAAPGDAYSPNCSALVRRITAVGGKRGHGRLNFPPPVEAAVNSSGALLTQFITDLQTAIDAITGFMSAAGWLPYLLHRYDPDLPESPPAPTPIVSHQVEAFVATQRRRLVRR